MFKRFKDKKTLTLYAPMSGELIKLEEVPDEVFSTKMIGDGIAIQPLEGIVYAPCDGEIVQLFPTKHAIGIKSKESVEILIHIGLETVHLKGEGFKSFIETGQNVKRGQKMIELDLEFLKEKVNLITPIVITNMDLVETIESKKGTVKGGIEELLKVNMK